MSKLFSEIPIEDEHGKHEWVPMQDAICRFLALGVAIETTCGMCGITDETFRRWRARGGEWVDSAPEDIPDDEKPYLAFYEATMRAQTKGIAWHEINLRRSAIKDGRISLEYLARRFSSEYARETQRVEHSGKLGLEVDEEKLRGRIAELMDKLAPAGTDSAS